MSRQSKNNWREIKMGKTKINERFSAMQDAKKNLFVPYIVAGDGGLDCLHERCALLNDGGAAAIELGIPFSDPVSDRPTIQEASILELGFYAYLDKVLDSLKSTSTSREIPIILMTYINPIFALGVEYFAEKCQ